MYLYSTLVSTHVTVIMLSVVLKLMVLYISVQHTGEYPRDCYYTICSSYINGVVCICTAHWWVHTWLVLYIFLFICTTDEQVHTLLVYPSIQHTNEYMKDCTLYRFVHIHVAPSHIRVQKNVSPKQGTTSLTGGWPLVVQNPEPHFTWRSNHQEGRVSIPPIDNIFASTEPEPGFPTSYVFIWCSMILGERWLFGLMELLTTTV